jgi:glycosyltransferase involved in cell wall biosynthesis
LRDYDGIVVASPSTPSTGSYPEQSHPAVQPAPRLVSGALGILNVGIDIRRAGEFGVGTYIKNLVLALARADDRDQYVLIGRQDQFARFGQLPPNFRFVEYAERFDSPRSHLNFHFVLRRLGLDVFHMPHRWVPYYVPGTYIVTLHDINNILFPNEGTSATAQKLRRHLLIRGLKRAARVIAVSNATKRDAVTHLGLDPRTISVVSDAVDEQVAQPVLEQERHRVLARYQIHDPFVLYAGRIQPHKNIPRLIEAFAVVKAELENHPSYHSLRLIIIGDEVSAFPAVRHSVMHSRIQHWVRFLGFVPIETLRVFYAAATAFMFPSLHEGFGLPPLEAMAHGTPVVTSSVSSLPETVGNAAVLVNPENVFDIARGLKQILLDDDFRQELRQRGYQQVKRFSWDRSAGQVREIYHAVTSEA